MLPSLIHAVDAVLGEAPEREAVIFGATRLSYERFAAHALALCGLFENAGLQRGDRIAVLSASRPEALASIIASGLLGLTWVGLSPRYRREEQAHILSDSGAKVLFSVTHSSPDDLEADLASHETERGIRVIRFDPDFWSGGLAAVAVERDRAAIMREWRRRLAMFTAEAPAVVVYTSGSTGRPKGAMLSHAGLAFRCETMFTDRFPLPGMKQIIDMPINHVGAINAVGLGWVAGGTSYCAERFDPAETLRLIAEEGIHSFACVPAMLIALLNHKNFPATDISSLRSIVWGTGKLSEALLDKLMTLSPDLMFSTQFGQTESNGPIAYTQLTRDRDILLNTVGTPDRRLQLQIADAEGRPLPEGEEGEIQARMPYPFLGYIGNPEATRDAFTADGFLRTGDLGLIRRDGSLVFRGRSREVYKSGGFNVYPREVEIALEAHPDVRAAVIVAVDDETWGQVGVAFVEVKAPIEEHVLIEWCKEKLATFKAPKSIQILDMLPRISVGKVDRKALAARLADANKV